MKKGFKILLIVAVCLVVLGIIMTVASLFFIKDVDFDSYSDAVSDIVNTALHRIGKDGDVDLTINAGKDGISVTTGKNNGGSHTFGSGGYNEPADENGKYSVSTDSVRKIHVDWVSGEVEIIPDETIDKIEFHEDFHGFTKPLSYTVKDRTLAVGFTENDGYLSISGGKDLKIRVPSAYALAIDEISISSVSADCTLTGLTVNDLEFHSVSGSLNCTGRFDEIETETVSGDVNIESSVCPLEFEADSTSGSVLLTLPEDSSFTLKFDSVSGDFSADLPILAKNGRYICGTGSSEFKVNSISGDMNISVLE